MSKKIPRQNINYYPSFSKQLFIYSILLSLRLAPVQETVTILSSYENEIRDTRNAQSSSGEELSETSNVLA